MTPQLRRRLVLIGFMGAGKTTVGKTLAVRLGWSFYDLDEMVERQENRSIARIFDESGESAFRKIESAALEDLLHRSDDDCIIALGGGAFVHRVNRETLERAGSLTVMLSAPVEELQRRCEAAEGVRPLARDARKFRQLFAAREQAYSLAQFRVETLGKDVEEIAREIEQWVFGSAVFLRGAQ